MTRAKRTVVVVGRNKKGQFSSKAKRQTRVKVNRECNSGRFTDKKPTGCKK